MNENKDKQRILMKDNLLVKTKYELSLSENRLYNLLLYKFQKEGNIMKCTITQDEVREVIKYKGGNTINAIGEILDSLSVKKIWIEEIKENDKYRKWHKYNLLNGCTYDEEFKTFEIQATSFIYDLIKKKFDNGGYTPTNLNIFLTLGNYYAQRLYELLRLWSNSKSIINYTIDEMRELLMLEDKYPLYADFKRRVINPAVKELNKSGCFQIEIKENKTGRRVESIDFIVRDLDSRIYFKETNSFNKNNCIEIEPNSKEQTTNKKISGDFYVPNKKLFTAKTLSDFINDFKDYDFKDSKNKKILQESILATLDKDDEEKIKVKAYNYFITTLNDKLEKSKATTNESGNTKKIKTRFHDINQRTDKYSSEELELMILESQRRKSEKIG